MSCGEWEVWPSCFVVSGKCEPSGFGEWLVWSICVAVSGEIGPAVLC